VSCPARAPRAKDEHSIVPARGDTAADERRHDVEGRADLQ